MRIVLTKYEADAMILKALGLDYTLQVRGDFHRLQSDHEIIIVPPDPIQEVPNE